MPSLCPVPTGKIGSELPRVNCGLRPPPYCPEHAGGVLIQIAPGWTVRTNMGRAFGESERIRAGDFLSVDYSDSP